MADHAAAPLAASETSLAPSAGAGALEAVPAGGQLTAGASSTAVADLPPPPPPASPDKRIIVSEVNLRSPSAVIADERYPAGEMPADFPTGNFSSWSEHGGVVPSVREWSTNPLNSQGGAFGVFSDGQSGKPCSEHGAIKRIRCSHAGKVGSSKNATNCQWAVHYEQFQSTDGDVGFTLLNGMFQHNHPLKTAPEELLADASTRRIPENYAVVAKDMASKGGRSIASINDFLKSMAAADGIAVSWTYEQLRSKYGASVQAKAFDMTEVDKFLRERVPACQPCGA